jgi:cephalosporin hydroxylase
MSTITIGNLLENSLNITLKSALQIMQNRIINNSTYCGIQTWKNPLDFWIYREIIWETRPDLIIEIGTHAGGSALALAHVCDNINHGKVISIDINHSNVSQLVRRHPRIDLIEGHASLVAQTIKTNNLSIMVIEDSSHTFDNTLHVLNTYSPLVTVGNYFIVEDGICHHGLDIGPNPGPFEAIEAFMNNNNDFVIDRSREDFLITWNPKGFLKKIA